MTSPQRLLSVCAVGLLLIGICGRPARASSLPGLVTIVSPPRQAAPAGSTQATVRLVAVFGTAVNGAVADPATFVPKMGGIAPTVLLPLFRDILDAQGHVVGKEADVSVPIVPGKIKTLKFKASVKSKPLPDPITGNLKVYKDSVSVKIEVRTNTPPVVKLVVDPPVATFGYAVTFDARGTTDADNDLLTYTWNFGDGSPTIISGPLITHIYGNANLGGLGRYTYTAQAVVTGDFSGVPVVVRASVPVQTGVTGKTLLTVTDPLNQEVVSISGTTVPVTLNVASASCGAALNPVTFKAVLNKTDVTSYFKDTLDPARDNRVVSKHADLPTNLLAVGPLTNNTLTLRAFSLPYTPLGGGTLQAPDISTTTFAATTNKPPTASFTATPSTIQAGDTVTFDASASNDPQGVPLTYAWDFGDGNTLPAAPAAVVTHVYAIPGAYTTRLTVSDGTFNIVADDSANPTVVRASPVTASFTVNPSSPQAGQSVTFDASSSTDSEGVPLSFAWNFGDGTSLPASSTAVVTHTYASGGTYTVNLTVYGGSSRASASASVVVKTPPSPPVPRFTISPAAPQTGQVVTFNASASTDPQGLPLTFAWNFGDGASLPASSSAVATHTYTSGGTFAVVLTASDGTASATTTAALTVTSSVGTPTPRFTASPTAAQVGLAVTFDASASTDPQNLPLTYAWEFGDGATLPASAADKVVTHGYAAAGTYVARLTVSNGTSAASIDDSSNPIVVAQPPPVPALTVSAASVDFGDLNGNLAIHETDPILTQFFVGAPFYWAAWEERMVEVTNTGTGTLVINSASIDNPDFIVPNASQAATVRLAAGESYFLGLRFNPRIPYASVPFLNGGAAPPPPPALPGPYAGTLKIVTNAGTQTVALAANVVGDIPGASAIRLFRSDTPMLPHGTNTFPDDEGSDIDTSVPDAYPRPAAVLDLGIVPSTKTYMWGALINEGDVAGTITGVDVVGDDGLPSPHWSARMVTGNPDQPGGLLPIGSISLLPAESLKTRPFGSERIQIVFAPQNTGAPQRLDARMTLHTDSGDLVVGLTGIGVYGPYYTVQAALGGGFEFQRGGGFAAGMSTSLLGSPQDGLSPATLTVQNIGRQPGTVTATLMPIQGGAGVFSLSQTSATLGSSGSPPVTFFLTFNAPAAQGNYSAGLKLNFNVNTEPAQHYLLHGYSKVSGTGSALGTSLPWYSFDGDDFSQTKMLNFDTQGGVINFSQIDGLQDPFEVATVNPLDGSLNNTVDMQQYSNPDWASLVVVNGKESTIDGGVFGPYSLTDPVVAPKLTPAAVARLQGGGKIYSGGILYHGAFLPGTNGNLDIRSDPTSNDPTVYQGNDPIRMDLTADGVLFYTEVAANPFTDPTTSIVTALKWVNPRTGGVGLVSADAATYLGHPNTEFLDMRAIKLASGGYRVFVVFDAVNAAGHQVVADMDLSASLVPTAHAELTGTFASGEPSAAVNSQMMAIDRNGFWYTSATVQNTNGTSTLQVWKEDLHRGASSRALYGQATVPIPDADQGQVLVDNLGNVFMESNFGLSAFSPSGTFGYFMSSNTYYMINILGDGTDTNWDFSDFNTFWLDK